MKFDEGLNPCSNGILKYLLNPTSSTTKMRLNPCSNGILKYKIMEKFRKVLFAVLILVLMEY